MTDEDAITLKDLFKDNHAIRITDKDINEFRYILKIYEVDGIVWYNDGRFLNRKLTEVARNSISVHKQVKW